MTSFDFAKEFDGYPFLDNNFDHSRLLTAVACVRLIKECGGNIPKDILRNESLLDVLQPARAQKIRALETQIDYPSEPLSLRDEERAYGALGAIADTLPEWKRLTTVPIVFRKIAGDSQAIGASIFARPQVIFLGSDAFSSELELSEQVLHELTHCWTYFIEEVTALANYADARSSFNLPSGTANRDPDEVLGALYVAINLIKFWSSCKGVANEKRSARLESLHQYRDGVVEMMPAISSSLTVEGKRLVDRLVEEAR